MIHRNKETQRRLAKYCHKTGKYKGSGFVFAGIYYDDFSENEREHRYVINYKRGMKYLKNYGNRKVRRYKGDLSKKGKQYLKLYNAKWEWY